MFRFLKWISNHKWMSHREYKANLSGMNIFFGAILGVVMAEYESSSPRQYIGVLLLSAALVVNILYMTSSKRRVFYSAMAAVVIGFLWVVALLDDMPVDLDATWLMNKYLPAMSVWWAMTLVLEFTPRDRPERDGRDVSKAAEE